VPQRVLVTEAEPRFRPYLLRLRRGEPRRLLSQLPQLGPFWHRSDLVRLTVTVRARNEKQLVVCAAAQFYLRPIETPEPYQNFFRTLEQALFVGRQQVGAAQH